MSKAKKGNHGSTSRRRRVTKKVTKGDTKVTPPEKPKLKPALRVLPDPTQVAKVLGELGATEAQLAEALGISVQALTKREANDPDLVATLKTAKASADERVEKSLFMRATGYDAPDTHFACHEGVVIQTPFTKRYPPDVTACIFWLKNRKPGDWRERTGPAAVVNVGAIAGVPDKVLLKLQKIAQETAARLPKDGGK